MLNSKDTTTIIFEKHIDDVALIREIEQLINTAHGNTVSPAFIKQWYPKLNELKRALSNLGD
jgi:hypothetical protein